MGSGAYTGMFFNGVKFSFLPRGESPLETIDFTGLGRGAAAPLAPPLCTPLVGMYTLVNSIFYIRGVFLNVNFLTLFSLSFKIR